MFQLLGVQSDNVQLTMRVSSLTAVQAQLQLTTDQLRWSSGQKDEALDQLKLQWSVVVIGGHWWSLVVIGGQWWAVVGIGGQ